MFLNRLKRDKSRYVPWFPNVEFDGFRVFEVDSVLENYQALGSNVRTPLNQVIIDSLPPAKALACLCCGYKRA